MSDVFSGLSQTFQNFIFYSISCFIEHLSNFKPITCQLLILLFTYAIIF